MKSARIIIFANQRKNAPNQPDGKGLIDLPATLIMELAQLVQTGQFTGTNQQTHEPFVQVACSCWRGDGTVGPNGGITVMSGQIESPSERAAYLASKQQQAPAQGGWGQPQPHPQGSGMGQWGQAGPPQGVAPAPQQPWGQPAPQPPQPPQQWGPPTAAPAPMPMQQPDPSQPAF